MTDNFLTGCRADRDSYARYLADAGSGGFRISIASIGGGPSRDVTAEHLQKVRTIIADLDALIADLEGDPDA